MVGLIADNIIINLVPNIGVDWHNSWWLVALISLAIIINQIISLTWDMLPFYKKAVKRKPMRIDLKQHAFVIIGGMVGFIAMSQNLLLAVICGIVGAWVGYGFKCFGKWLTSKMVEEQKVNEVLLLYEIVSLYISSGYTMHEALSAGLYLVDSIKPALRKCLDNWSQGPQRALEKMNEELNNPETNTLIGILQRGIIIGPDKITNFLAQESETMNKIREFKTEQGLGVRPIIQTLYLIFPGLALIGVTLLPVGYHISKMLTSIRLQ